MHRRTFMKTVSAGVVGTLSSFDMPGVALAQPAGQKRPAGVGLTLEPNTWTPRAAPALGRPNASESTGPYPAGLGGKLSRIASSAQGLIVCCGGTYYTELGHPNYDKNGTTGLPTVWRLDLSQGKDAPFERLHGLCPVDPSEEMPGRPHSCCVASDDARGRLVVMPGWMASSQTDDRNRYAAICPGVVQVLDAMIFNYSRKRWSKAPWGPPPWGGGTSNYEKYGGDDCSRYGAIDPVTNCFYRIERRSGSIVAILHLDGRAQPWESTNLGLDVKVVSSQLGIDVKGRRLWFIAPVQRLLLGWNLDTRKLDRNIPLPAKYVMPADPPVHFAYLEFFSTPRAVVMPGIADFYGTLQNVIVYWDDTQTFEVRPGVAGVNFNTFGYDTVNDVGFGCGVGGGGDGDMKVSAYHWLYRVVRGSSKS
jgi:hypothetical protein